MSRLPAWSDRPVTPRPDGTAAGTAVRPGQLVVALAVGVTTLSLLQSLVVPVLGTIEDQLEISPGAAGWVLTANLLAAAVLTPVLGRLGDLRGERPVILGILATVAVGTLLAVLTTSLPLLLLGRILQGASYGLFPLSISVLRRELPGAKLSVAMSVVSSTLAVGGVAGLVATGLLVGDGGDYRPPFWIGLGVTLLALVLAARVLPHRPPSGSGRVDWWGALVLGAGLVLLLLPVSQGNAWGWRSPAVVGCLAGSALVLAGWVVLQRRTAQPLVRPGMLADRRTIVPNIAGLMTGIALFVSFLGVLQYVQAPPEAAGYGFGASVLEASVVYLLPGGVAGIIAAPFAGKVVTRLGALPTLLAGAASGVAGFLLLAFLRGEPWLVVLAGLLTQLSVTVAYAALPALVVQAVQDDETGVANAVNSIARSVGQALGSTVAVTLIAAGVDPATGFPRESAYTGVGLIGALATLAVMVVAVAGMAADRRGGGGHRPDPLAGVEEATARAGEWSPVSGIR
jgi:predicted MFS family arabinose efflux permease